MRKITLVVTFAFISALGVIAQTKQGVNATQMQNPSHVIPPMPLQQGPALPAVQAISGYYEQGFEGTTFPPTGWNRFNVQGANQWTRSTAQAHTGSASALIQYQATGGEDWLIMPRFLVGATTDSVTFWMRLAFSGYQPDSLCIKVSTTDSLPASFTTTLLKLREGFEYPANATTWYKYKVSLQNYVGQMIYVAFKHYNNNGDGLYIDDVSIGTKPTAEVTPTAITTPSYMPIGAITPQASFYNNGSATQTFNVTMEINPGGYISTMPVNALAPSASASASFASWTPSSIGTYTMKVYTQLPGDANTNNDTLTKVLNVLNVFPNNGWSSQAALPAGRWATAPAFDKSCIASTDTGFIYLVSGSDASFTNSTLTSRYNTSTGTWSNMAAIPASRLQITPVQVNGKIYVIGGYSSSFSPVNTTSIYDIATNTWSTGANMPTAVGDYAIGVYADTLIYVISGYTGTSDVNTVQIYNVNTNTWTTGTPKTGNAVAGGRMGITGNNIVFVGGYSQTVSASLSDAYIGVINPASPQTITWTAIAAYPAGTASRLAGGTSFQDDGRVYFGGGDPTGSGAQAINAVYGYNTITGQWEIGPNMITGVSNISSLTGIVHNNTLYLVTMGGYNGSIVGTYHEWLELGPANPLPYAQADTAICTGASFPLDTYNGTSYSWTPSTGLSSTSIASPIASPTTTITYAVTMGKGYGCPVTDNVIVVVNTPPVASAGTDVTICAGDNTMLNATGANDYQWLPSAGLDNASISNPTASPSSTTTYTVTVTSTSTGCASTDEVTVNVNPLPAASAGADVAICSGDQANLVATGGDTYSWMPSTGLSNSAIDNPVADPSATTIYTVTVTNTTTGCSNTDDVEVVVNALPSVTTSTTDATCFGNSDGTAMASVSGTGTYSFAWTTGATTDTETNLAAGSYTVTVTDDATGCESTAAITVNEPMALTAAVSNDTVTGCIGTLNANVTGGTAPYTFQWNDPSSQTTASATNLCSGTYSVTITDNNGCVTTVTAEVVTATGIESISGNHSLVVSPNPTQGIFTIEANFTSTQRVMITLANVLGEGVIMIDEGMITGAYIHQVDISSLPAGIYFMQVLEGNDITSVKKIVKQ